MTAIFDKGRLDPCPDPFNLAAYVLRHADDLPDKIALAILSLSGSERWSYARLKAAVLGTGNGLLQSGLQPGDRLLLRLGNTVDFPLLYLGAIAVGIIPVPTSSQLTEPEVVKLVGIIQPKAVAKAPRIACPKTIGCQIIAQDEYRSFRDLPPAEFALGDPNRLSYILFTSGTSGKPAAVMHAHRAIWARQMMWKDWYDLTDQDRLLHAGALNWSFTLGTGLLDPWTIGATSLIPADGVELSALPLLLKRHDATIFAAAPGVFRRLTNGASALHLPKLRHGLTAGEKIPASVRDSWTQATGTEVYEAFGMSECSTFISGSPGFPASDSLGRPQSGRRVAILGDDGPVPFGEPGAIAVAKDDPGLMLGYLDDAAATNAKLRDEWFVTDDVGIMHADFSISYHGRRDDVMNAGGFRVSPIEVENILSTHPDIHEVACTDIEIKPDTRIIAAFYTSDHDLSEADLKAFAQANLARYKQPRVYQRVESLPRGNNNKLLRKALRQRATP